MLGLFSIDKIEDYYEVDNLIAVSHDRAKLEKYIADAIADFELHKLAHEKYCEIRKTMPKFAEEAPVKRKLGFVPKTREEHKMAEQNAREYEALNRAYQAQYYAFERAQDEEAFVLMCRKEGLWQTDIKKSRVVGFQCYYSPPEYKIAEVEVW